MPMQPEKVSFKGSQGATLAARFDRPAGQLVATAIFAHCFTCCKDIFAARVIASELVRHGIAVLRFDFTGLGASEGEFANTDFSSNCGDLIRAADWLRDNAVAPKILIGHSLGGAAVLAIAGEIPEVAAVATIGAPADADHVIRNFGADIERIEEQGEAEVSLAGRQFRIGRQFLDDVRSQNLAERIGMMRKALLVLHSPVDDVVGIDNASEIFLAAKHPKSFVSLDDADHLLSRREDAVYAASIIATWAGRYIGEARAAEGAARGEGVVVAETGQGKFQAIVSAGRHDLLADEPERVGGLDTGPSPYEYLSAALGACTTMTLRMYADRKGIDLGRISVAVDHAKVHVDDCEDCAAEKSGSGGRIDRFERRIAIDGKLDPALREKMLEIAGKCPVHRTLEQGAAVVTRISQ